MNQAPDGPGPMLEIRRLTPEWTAATAAFLQAVGSDADARFFTPHPFDRATVEALAASPGRDLYAVLVEGGSVLAYGLLRGWNEGYEVPSLGVAVAPAARGRGLGRLMMHFLHAAARRRGALQVRLRVHAGNEKALALYREMGYRFEGAAPPGDGLRVGFKRLDEAPG
jgi:ribosomal protein S18 acetylase RimI-like enzyme